MKSDDVVLYTDSVQCLLK